MLFPGEIEDSDLALSRLEQSFKNFNGGGLSRPIRSEEPETFPCLDIEIEAADRLHLTVVSLTQIAALDRCPHEIDSIEK